MDDDITQRGDELEALAAIYGGALTVTADQQTASLLLPDAEAEPHLLLRLHIPDTYPSRHAPVFELHSDAVPSSTLSRWAEELEQLFSTGDVILFQWAECLRERWQDFTANQQQAQQEAEQRRQLEEEALAVAAAEALGVALAQAELDEGAAAGPGATHGQAERQQLEAAMAEVSGSIVHGEPFTEKRSTFQAHLAPATTMLHVEAFMELLLQNSKIRAATHNILSYRIRVERPSKHGGEEAVAVWLQDFDDDGEDAAGGRLLHMMQLANCQNVVVVVSRWYGGILLGPARFQYINNVARQLLESCGYIDKEGSKKKGGKKR